MAQPLVSCHTVHITDTNIPESKNIVIDKTYKRVNHMHIVHCHHLYMNEIHIVFIARRINWIWKIFNCNTFHWLLSIFTPMLTLCFYTDCFAEFFCIIFIWLIFLMHYHAKIISSLLTFHWTNNTDMSNIKWQFSVVGM